MKRKILVRGSLVIVVLVVAIGLYLVLSLDAIVARAIEREGSRVVGAPVRVGSVDLALSKGEGRIRSLRVGNPEGFAGSEAFALQEIAIALEPASLREPPIRLARIDVGETSVNLEVDAQGRSNLDRILQNARQSSDPAADTAEGEEAPTRIAIDRLHFEGGTVRLERAGRDETHEVALPGFDREGVGGAEGATGGEIARVVVTALARQAGAAAAASEAKRAVEKELGESAGEAAGSLVRGLLGD